MKAAYFIGKHRTMVLSVEHIKDGTLIEGQLVSPQEAKVSAIAC
jgi:hypothetical protein